MKRNSILPGIFLVIIGLYFLLKQMNITIPYSDLLVTWPSILVIIGLILAFQGFSNRDDNKMFSGTLLLGFGIYFHGVITFNYWKYHWAFFTLVISIAFFMKYFVNKRDGIVPGFILLGISALYFFSGYITHYIGEFQAFWPIALIGIGIYFIFFKK